MIIIGAPLSRGGGRSIWEIIMKTFDTIPTPDFLEAYRRVTGSNDVSPRAIFAAVLDAQTAGEIHHAHAAIVRAKEDQRREIEKLKDAVREIQATLGFDHLIDEP
jgi:hypothetical protein